MKKEKKAQIWVSAILYLLIISTAIVLILKVGVPIIDGMKKKSNYNHAKETMLNLDKTIQDVANEGEGSQRIMPIEIKDGKLTLNDNEISWEMRSDTKIIEDSSNINIGNMVVSSNANVRTIETSNYFIMQTNIDGDIFNVSFKKIGNATNYASVNTSDLIDSVYYDGTKMNGTFDFTLNADPSSGIGNGYTEMVPMGNNTNLGRAKVVLHMNSTLSGTAVSYDLVFTLMSFSDFFTVEVKNLE